LYQRVGNSDALFFVVDLNIRCS